MTEADEQLLLNCPAAQRTDLISEDIEERYFRDMKEWLCETDKAWDAIHRASNNSALDYEYRSPLHGAILGGQQLYFESDYIISYKERNLVQEIAPALAKVDEGTFRNLYFQIDPKKYIHPLSEQDFEYSWEWLKRLQPFYLHAAETRRAVIFTTDQ